MIFSDITTQERCFVLRSFSVVNVTFLHSVINGHYVLIRVTLHNRSLNVSFVEALILKLTCRTLRWMENYLVICIRTCLSLMMHARWILNTLSRLFRIILFLMALLEIHTVYYFLKTYMYTLLPFLFLSSFFCICYLYTSFLEFLVSCINYDRTFLETQIFFMYYQSRYEKNKDM